MTSSACGCVLLSKDATIPASQVMMNSASGMGGRLAWVQREHFTSKHAANVRMLGDKRGPYTSPACDGPYYF